MRRLGLALALGITACSALSDDPASTAEDGLEMSPGVDESALDRSVSPCDDFYQFACGGFIAGLPADVENETRGFTELRRQQSALFTRIVKDVLDAPAGPAEKKAAAYHRLCLETNDLESARPYVAGVAARVDQATTSEELFRVLASLHKTRTSAFFTLFVTADTVRQGRHSALVARPRGFDWRTDYTKPESVAARKETLVERINRYEPGAPDAKRRAAVTVDIESKLAALSADIGWGAGRPLGLDGLELAAPNIPWRLYLDALGAPKDLGPFEISTLDAFHALDQLIVATPLADLRTYVKTAWYAQHDYKTLPPEELAKTCERDTTMMFSEAFVPRFLAAAGVDDVARARAHALFDAIADAFHQQLAESPFLDLSTRIEAQVKLRKMRAAIAFSDTPEDYADVKIDSALPIVALRARFNERSYDRSLAEIGKPIPLFDVGWSPEQVNASYNGTLNKIAVPGGILGGYFFSPTAKPLANFAAIGAVLGHEITHGFDDNGRHADGDGVIRDWWTPETAAAYEERAQCLVDQYDAFTVPTLDPKTGQPAHVNGELTLGENISDDGAVRLAYRASKVATRAGKTVAGFDPKQQFFVGYAQVWCTKQSDAVVLERLATDPHAPPKARVNIPLANFEEFQSAFQCQAGSPMAPKNRCRMW